MRLAVIGTRDGERPVSAQEMAVSTALVALTPADRELNVGSASGHMRADFVAHLIATSAQLPQTRARRRAEPADAVAAYRALGQWPTPPGGALRRAL
jgi:hypothetical protein